MLENKVYRKFAFCISVVINLVQIDLVRIQAVYLLIAQLSLNNRAIIYSNSRICRTNSNRNVHTVTEEILFSPNLLEKTFS